MKKRTKTLPDLPEPVVLPDAGKILQRYVDYYQKRSEHSTELKQFANAQDLPLESLKKYHAFYVDGSIHEVLGDNTDLWATLRLLGLTTGDRSETLAGCVVFPLYNEESIANLAGYDLNVANRSVTVNDTGVFNFHLLKSKSSLVLAASVIQAVRLEAHGEAAIAVFPGGRELFELTVKDYGVEVRAEGETTKSPETTDDLRMEAGRISLLRSDYAWELIPSENDTPGRVRLIGSIKRKDGKVYRFNQPNIWNSRQRSGLIEEVSLFLGKHGTANSIDADVDLLITHLEAKALRQSVNTTPKQLTAEEQAAAIAFLKDPNLLENCIEATQQIGHIIGEHKVLLIGLVCIFSRLCKGLPLSFLLVAKSAAGKSAVLDALFHAVEPERRLSVTRITGSVLFYFEENQIHRKCLYIKELEGAVDAEYPIREMLSSGELTLGSTVKDRSGNHSGHMHKVPAETVLLTSTTHPNLSDESLNRFLIGSLDESLDQTQKILEGLRASKSVEALQSEAQQQQTATLLHHVQQMLDAGVEVRMPKELQLSINPSIPSVRREALKCYKVLEVIAFLRQMQKPVQEHAGRKYVMVDEVDVEWANKVFEAMVPIGAELPPNAARLFNTAVQQIGEDKETLFTINHIKQWTAWHYHAIYRTLKVLEKYGFIRKVKGSNGTTHEFALVASELEDATTPKFELNTALQTFAKTD